MSGDADPAAFLARLEALRRSGISIDRDGELWHEGEVVRHGGLRRALFTWLDRNDDGRYVLRLDAKRFAWIDVADTPLVARAARATTDGPALLALSDGTEAALDPSTLTVDDAGVLRCTVRGRLEARLSTSALAALADDLTLDPPRFRGTEIRRRP